MEEHTLDRDKELMHDEEFWNSSEETLEHGDFVTLWSDMGNMPSLHIMLDQ